MTRIMVNGEMGSDINVMDRGLHYGDGVFETMRVVNNVIPLWEKHWQRLSLGCERLSIHLPAKNEIEKQLAKFLEGIGHAVVKLIVTRGSGERGYAFAEHVTPSIVLTQSALPGYPENYHREGITARICNTRLAIQPALAGIKHLNRLEQVMARAEWNERNIAEGIMLDTTGNVIEGVMSNLFLVNNDTVITPALDQCGVAGVMRQFVLEVLEAEGIKVEIRDVSLDDLLNAGDAFLTNSVIGLWPVKKIDDTVYQQGNTSRFVQSKIQEIFNVT